MGKGPLVQRLIGKMASFRAECDECSATQKCVGWFSRNGTVWGASLTGDGESQGHPILLSESQCCNSMPM